MSSKEEFRAFGHAMIDYIIDYHENIKERPVLPNVKPGYLRPLIPEEAPEEPEQWQDIMKDLEKVIMPGVTHWHSPQFHAYFPTACSYPSIGKFRDVQYGDLNIVYSIRHQLFNGCGTSCHNIGEYIQSLR